MSCPDDFSLKNIPFGVVTDPQSNTFIATRVYNTVWNIQKLANDGHILLGSLQSEENKRLIQTLSRTTLNEFAALGQNIVSNIRQQLKNLIHNTDVNKGLQLNYAIPFTSVTPLLPFDIGDYTDFYSSKFHATNVGILFRGRENALQRNWTHLPVGYHGRSSSVIVSGTDFSRPQGQILIDNQPIFSETKKLDFEVEFACFIASPNSIGTCIPVDDADKYIFGYVVMNDWSARDIQAWEYVPLGPFLGKSFATTVSPWVVTPQALEPFKTELPLPDHDLLPYLKGSNINLFTYDIGFKVFIRPHNNDPDPPKSLHLHGSGIEYFLGESNSKDLNWSFPQMIAHHTVNGCPLRTGDLLGSGTISSEDIEQRGSISEDGSVRFGSLLEATKNMQDRLFLTNSKDPSDEEKLVRGFLRDYDRVNIHAVAGPGVGFGDCYATILPAHKIKNF